MDGVHRLANAYRNEQPEIEAYLFEPHEHMDAMVGELSKNLFKVHHNIVTILNYSIGLVDEYIPYWEKDPEELSLEERRWKYIYDVQPAPEMDVEIRKIGSGQWVFFMPYEATPIIEFDADEGIQKLKQAMRELFPSVKKVHLHCDKKSHPFPYVINLGRGR